MPIYHCNQCAIVVEDTTLQSGSKSTCRKCQAPVTLIATVFYVEKLHDRYRALLRELDALKQQEAEQPTEKGPQEQQCEPVVAPPKALAPSPTFELPMDQIHSTLVLATETQHEPLAKWFASKQIKPVFDYAQVDTTGFFDETAAVIGEHYSLLSPVLDLVRHGYRREWSWVSIELNSKTEQEQQTLKTLLRQMYSHTFFSRHAFKKDNNSLGLALQPAQQVRKFFEGGWLEWWAFMNLLTIALEPGLAFNCARNVRVEFQNDELRELDVLFLLQNKPIVVECKSGEFRGELEKYTKLSKRLGLAKSQFIICNPDLAEEQAQGLTAMYGLTFVNLKSFVQHIRALL